MKKFFLSLLAFFLLPSFTWAGGKVFLSPGETLSLSPTVFLEEPLTYIWDITGENISAPEQTGKDFSYTFPTSGTYFVSLSVTDKTGKTQTTRTEVFVAENYKKSLPIHALLFSTPQIDEKKEATVDIHSPRVLLYAKESEGNIVEYHIDTDISVDSDGDGNPANDIDNAHHQSFFDGSAFPVVYSDTSSPKTAQLKIVAANGETATTQSTFHFAQKNIDVPLRAILSTLPPSDARGNIHVFGDTADVIFYAAGSQGDILQYRIDTDISIDSDGDGNPANDIDNKTHPFFHTGEPFLHSFSRTNGNEQVAQLIVVSPEGKGSLLQRRIVFEQTQKGAFAEERKNEMNPVLLLNTLTPAPEEIVQFQLLGVPDNATISWDFDGNGTIDHKGNEMVQTYSYSAEETYTPEVIITLGEGSVIRSQTITVKKPQKNTSSPTENTPQNSIPPVSDFSFTQDGARFLMTSSAQADTSIPNNTLVYAWDFGNGKTSSEKNPQIAYEKAGKYTLSLTVTDITGNAATKKVSVSVSEEDIQKTFPENNIPNSFSLKKNGATLIASFADTSKIDAVLWDFGDGNTSADLSPEHTYATAGTYTVRATLRMTNGETKIIEDTVEITEDDIAITPTKNTGENANTPSQKRGFSWLKFLLYFPLILLFLFLIGSILLLLFRKVESPDLQFEEIVHEEIERWRGKMRSVVQTETTKTNTKSSSSHSPFLHAEKQDTTQVVVEEKGDTTSDIHVGKTPEWLKNASVAPKTNHPDSTTPIENRAPNAEEKDIYPENTKSSDKKEKINNSASPKKENTANEISSSEISQDKSSKTFSEPIQQTEEEKTQPSSKKEEKRKSSDIHKEEQTSMYPSEKNISSETDSSDIQKEERSTEKETATISKNVENIFQDEENLPDWLKPIQQTQTQKKEEKEEDTPPPIPSVTEKPASPQTTPKEKNIPREEKNSVTEEGNVSNPHKEDAEQEKKLAPEAQQELSTKSSPLQQNRQKQASQPVETASLTPKSIQEKSETIVSSPKTVSQETEILRSISSVSHTAEESHDLLQDKETSGEINLASFPSGDGEITTEKNSGKMA